MAKQHSARKKASTAQAALDALDALIDIERRRLNHAEAILLCLSVTLEECDDPHATTFRDAADAASNLIAEAVDRLDSVTRDRVLAGEGDVEVDTD